MVTTKQLATAVAVFLGAQIGLQGQAMYPFTFNGTCYQTNSSGKIVSSKYTDQTMLQEIASSAGITDLSTLKLVYHEQGNSMGDTVDIINPQNGAVFDTRLGFYFCEVYRRTSLVDMIFEWRAYLVT